MSSIGPQLPPHLQLVNSSEQENTVAGPHIPSQLLTTAPDEEGEDEDDYTPALPPDLASTSKPSPDPARSSTTKKILGPALPQHGSHSDDDSDDDVGPMPLPAGYENPADVDGVKQFLEQEEKRRKNIEEAAKPKALKRDEWMLKPPSSSELLSTLDPSKLTKGRQFSRSTAPAKTTDNSLWTETPAERQHRLADEVSGKKRKAANSVDQLSPEEVMEISKRRRRDEEIRQSVLDHTNKVRGGALVNTHVKSIKDDQEDDKDKAIWDHSRDMALGGRLMDDNSRDKMIRDARGLGDRFSTGKRGGFL
ncbi:hypothetical protein E1B28_009667 [Marasmius oreades]|uniref:DUF3752 domain-containing protein n=1 Tax=Marasmius oreades TaxID=181124 RepID=A0A9P7USV2_9AGAR|nr:uncharacterized protein E1B28_009667 [Marasmius oreades]KAG7090559.1 hypothetical protein E1B28_009667 [Marasmius oreades]